MATVACRLQAGAGGALVGFRYRKSLRLAPGIRVNVTGKGLSSASIGKPGATLNLGRGGIRGTVGLPGSGLSYSSRRSAKSALLPGLIIAGLLALVFYALRGSRPAQAGLLLLGVGALASLGLGQTATPPQHQDNSQLQETATGQNSVESVAAVPLQLPGAPPTLKTQTYPPAVNNTAQSPETKPLLPVERGPEQIEPTLVVAKLANVRSAPSMTGTILGQLAAGAVLSVIETSGHWMKVRQDGNILGWVNRSRLSSESTVGDNQHNRKGL